MIAKVDRRILADVDRRVLKADTESVYETGDIAVVSCEFVVRCYGIRYFSRDGLLWTDIRGTVVRGRESQNMTLALNEARNHAAPKRYPRPTASARC